MNKRWTHEEDSCLKSNYEEFGLAEAFSYFKGERSYQAIKKRVRRLGLVSLRSYWSEEEINLLKDIYSKKSLEEIVILFPNRTESSISSKASELGITKSGWSKEDIVLLQDNYYSLSEEELVVLFKGKYSYGAIKRKCSFLGIKKPVRKYCVKDDFFELPAALNSYWAGFLAADGYVCTRLNRLGVTLAYKDISHLEKFKEDINYEGFIKEGWAFSFGKQHKYCTLVFTSKYILKDLNTIYNIVDRKSLILKPPVIKGKEFLSYIIGYLDGDGSMGIRYYKRAGPSVYLSFLGTKALLSEIRCFFDLLVAPNKRKSNLRKVYESGVYLYSVGGIRASKIIEILCEVEVPRLRRKWEPAIKFLNEEKGYSIDYDYYSF
ncbi:MAG: hypothetical protein KAS32_05410 [Candidatus Peribacteraceae bacterium]|nr:hypothetical protein [Candidatus Peribacteraceae bacterium]